MLLEELMRVNQALANGPLDLTNLIQALGIELRDNTLFVNEISELSNFLSRTRGVKSTRLVSANDVKNLYYLASDEQASQLINEMITDGYEVNPNYNWHNDLIPALDTPMTRNEIQIHFIKEKKLLLPRTTIYGYLTKLWRENKVDHFSEVKTTRGRPKIYWKVKPPSQEVL